MHAYLLDNSVLSVLLDPEHAHQEEVRAAVERLAPADIYVAAVTLAELAFGVRLAVHFGGRSLPVLEQILEDARAHAVLETDRHTADAYAELKANMAKRYLAKASRKARPRWLEDWIDKTTGKALQVDENDLWTAAHAKARDLTLLHRDGDMQRIADADSTLRVLRL